MALTPSQRSRSKPASEKATYHQIDGAGSSHVLRQFFGLSASDEAAIERDLGFGITANLAKSEGSGSQR